MVATAMQLYLFIYGCLALGHIALQLVLGHVDYVLDRRRWPRDPRSPRLVTVVVPVYNEDPSALRACLESIRRQDHGRLEVIVVDDGSSNRGEHEAVYAEFDAPGWSILREPENRGKREAQKLAFDRARGELLVTIDSDTILRTPDAIRKIQRRFADPRVGAVTGNVAVANREDNVLTRLIGYRYWMAFHQERAAQSLFGVVMCASGPFAAYRSSIVAAVKDDYVAQRFLGKRCTFGDDRHLTNLVLARGHRVVFDREARAGTHVPANLRDYLRQQTRWNKSFYREILWTLRFAHRRHPYLAVELLLQATLPLMLLTAVESVLLRALLSDPAHVAGYLAVVAGIAATRTAYGMLRTRDLGFLLFVAYGFVHLGLMIPTRLYALATIGRAHWGTRDV
jgi:hyaluronan synthase/N-acetylglucosaminyltransferase